MNERQAREAGYEYTGVFEWTYNKEKVKARQDDLKKQGYKSVIVTVPADPLSRGGRGGGLFLYAEKKYFVDQETKELLGRLGRIEGEKAYALKEYQTQLTKIEENESRMRIRLQELRNS